MTRSVTLSVSLNDIAAPFISRIEELVKEHPGKCGLKISINDPLENIGVDMPSKTYKVAISEEFLSGLGQIEKVVYRRSEEQPSEPQSLMRISYAVFCLK